MRPATVKEARLYFLPVQLRVPLKFGNQVLESITCARARVTIESESGKRADGWGETPLSVGWVWPAPIDFEERHTAMKDFTALIAAEYADPGASGHPIELGHDFIEGRLEALRERFNSDRAAGSELPHLAALVCFSPFDIAVHDAYGKLHDVEVYQTYNREFMRRDLGDFITSDSANVDFSGQYPCDYLVPTAPQTLPVWHLVGGLDPISADELSGDEPDDGFPILLRDWIREDSLDCLKIKLRGNDLDWDYQRVKSIGEICKETGAKWLSADFNCMVHEPDYVNEILDRLLVDDPLTHQKILYVEQPFPYDLEANQIDVRSVSARKPLFMDESAHDWKFVKMGRELGWTGVALKTCKTQTGALLSLCWAKAHGMTLMVQDLTNPMLAQVPHFLLAANAGTIMGVESNAMQFYPAASLPEQAVHPGLFKRQGGMLDASTLSGAGFGYRVDEIERELPAPVA